MNIIDELKALPFTLEVEHDTDGICVQAQEFPDAFVEEKTIDEAVKSLAQSMKDWVNVLSADFPRWQKGREELVPYFLKILVSSEEELVSCLRSSRLVNSGGVK